MNHRNLVIGLLSFLLVPACAEEEEALIVLHAPTWGDDGSCVIEASNDTVMGRGYLDLAFANSAYLMPAILENRLLGQSAATQNSGVDNSELQLRDVDVQLSSAQWPELIDNLAAANEAFVEFTVPLQSVSIAAGERHGVGVEVVPAATADAMRAQFNQRWPDAAQRAGASITVVAESVFHALRSGNTSGSIGVIDSRTFTFPIVVCSGCLLRCGTCPDGTCPASEDEFVGGVCGNSQDLPLWPAICGGP
jgi:hypothetical protein